MLCGGDALSFGEICGKSRLDDEHQTTARFIVGRSLHRGCKALTEDEAATEAQGSASRSISPPHSVYPMERSSKPCKCVAICAVDRQQI
eukprot:4108133-Pyramimonas_sp.AAC.1